MGYTVSLTSAKTGKPVKVPLFQEGGIPVVDGSKFAELGVTYNYCKLFDFKSLDGKTVEETASLLWKAISKLGLVRDPNYLKPTEGNVGSACNILLGWAHLHPKAVWQVH